MTIAEMQAREAELMAQREKLRKNYTALGEAIAAGITAELHRLRLDLAIARCLATNAALLGMVTATVFAVAPGAALAPRAKRRASSKVGSEP